MQISEDAKLSRTLDAVPRRPRPSDPGRSGPPSSSPATRVWLVVLSSTPGRAMMLPLPPMLSASAFPVHCPLSMPLCFWKATKWSPSFAGSMLSGLFHQMVT